MSRSKRNWDYLITEDGQYPEKGSKGGGGGSGTKGQKGQKGSVGVKGVGGVKGQKGLGEKGEKGDASRTFEYKGEVANEAALPSGAAEGDVYKALDTGDYYAWDGSAWNNIGQVNSVKGETGQKGDDGTPGLKGANGEKGSDGSKGDTGTKGDDGAKGDDGTKGDDGEKGEGGEKGESGEKGDKGEKGRRGEKGLKGVGDTGEKGEKGQTGVGTTGDKGNKGETGGVGSSGPKGEKGLDGNGTKGQKGQKGLDGTDGDKGEPGTGGTKGDDGDQGTKGDDGDKGDKGESVKGEKGEKGAFVKGEPGDEGEKGEKGNYIKGEKGQTGIGLNGDKGEKGQKGINGFTGAKGDEGDQGQKGEAGRTFNYQGEVATPGDLPNPGNEGDVYKATSTGDFYAWNGASWDNIGQLNAIKGASGQKGDEGAAGPKGDRGDKGIGGTAGGKGEKGAIGNNGNDGDKGSKGQKGVEADGSLYLPLTGGTMKGDFRMRPPGAGSSTFHLANNGDVRFYPEATGSGLGLALYAKDLPSSEQIAFQIRGDGKVKAGANTLNPFLATEANDVVTKQYLDNNSAYLPIAGGRITGNLTVDGAAVFGTGGVVSIDGVKGDIQANKITLEDGGTCGGTLFFNDDDDDDYITTLNANRMRLAGRDAAGNQRTFVSFANVDSSGPEGDPASGYSCRIYHLVTPTEDYHGANKLYVDSKPPGMRFEATDSGAGAGNLATGQFLVGGGGNIYLFPESYDGVDLAVDGGASQAVVDMMCSVWDADGNLVYSMKGQQVNYNNGSNNYIRVDHASTKKTSTVTSGEVYYVSIPGITS